MYEDSKVLLEYLITYQVPEERVQQRSRAANAMQSLLQQRLQLQVPPSNSRIRNAVVPGPRIRNAVVPPAQPSSTSGELREAKKLIKVRARALPTDAELLSQRATQPCVVSPLPPSPSPRSRDRLPAIPLSLCAGADVTPVPLSVQGAGGHLRVSELLHNHHAADGSGHDPEEAEG